MIYMTLAATPRVVVTDSPDSRKITVAWPDGKSSAFHYVWLRHSGRCPRGMPNDTAIKIDLLPDDPESLSIGSLRMVDDLLVIRWNDGGVETMHEISTLRQMAYDDLSRRERKHRPCLWQASNAETIPVFDFAQLEQNESVLKVQLAVRDFGIARLRDVPVTPGTIEQVAGRFGPIHVNNYGRIFDVRTQTNVGLGSNTGVYLGPHTDENYRHTPPGISLFHCLMSSPDTGGESILVDGFMAAEELKRTDPGAFDILCRVPVLFQRLALPEEDMRAHGRIIATDIDGDVEGIRFTDRTIPPQDLPDHMMEPVYKAIRAFWKIINSNEMKFQYLMQPGDLHIFDNHRVLHGRTAFDPSKAKRHLQQCSVNRDEFHNTLRTRAAQLGLDAKDLTMTGGA